MDASSDSTAISSCIPDGTRIAAKLDPDPVAKDAQYGFNAGAAAGCRPRSTSTTSDFLLRVISDIAARTPVDLRRVYVTGMSNGGMMAYAMAAQASTYIAAIAVGCGPGRTARDRTVAAGPDDGVPQRRRPDRDVRRRAEQRPQVAVLGDRGLQQWVKADGCDNTPHPDKTIKGAGQSEGLTATGGLHRMQGRRAGRVVAADRLRSRVAGRPFNTGPEDTWILDGVGRGTTLIDANELMLEFSSSARPATRP